jgi:hypothetical protein
MSASQQELGLELVLESQQELESASELALGWQEDLEWEKR